LQDLRKLPLKGEPEESPFMVSVIVNVNFGCVNRFSNNADVAADMIRILEKPGLLARLRAQVQPVVAGAVASS
jgi:hypothetical protein